MVSDHGQKSFPVDMIVMAAGAQIVLIEDEPVVCRALQRYLSLDGYEVLAFDSLAALDAALAAFARFPDLLIADFHLGAGERGIDAMERLEARFGACPPAIILTGDITGLPAVSCGDRTVRLLNKPFAGRELSATVQELLAMPR